MDFALRAFATFYLATATVILLKDAEDAFLKREKRIANTRDMTLAQAARRGLRYMKVMDFFNRKPFICEFCLCFWWALPVSLPHFDPFSILGIAGAAALLSFIKLRLEMVVV